MNSENNWISDVKRITEECYEGNWDFHESADEYSYHHLYILFPEFTISNSTGQEHLIRELYLRLSFNNNGILSDISATRGTVTQAEIQSNYPHSHIGSNAVRGGWGGFCWGSGPIRRQIESLQRRFDPLMFEAFILAMDTYLQWESLEGGPYQYMADVKKRMNIRNVDTSVLEDTFKRFINVCTDVNFTVVEGRKIEIDPTDEDFMASILPLVKEEHLVMRTNDGQFFTEGENQEYDNKDLHFEFKGEKVYLKVIDDDPPEENSAKYPHPQITEYIAQKLSRKLTLYAYKTGTRTPRQTESVVIGGIMVQDM